MLKKLFVLIIFGCYLTQAQGHLDETHITHKLKDKSEAYLAQHFFNGIYNFSSDQGSVLKGAKGFYDYANHKLLNVDQIMPIASATKTFTAAAILKLRDQRKIDVNDKISKYLDANSNIWEKNKVPAWADRVTVHNLLTHTSGLPEYFMQTNIDVGRPHEEINKIIANYAAINELKFEPGRSFDYCNTNYVLLGIIIEKISGRSLSKFFNKEFFVPLGLINTKLISLDDAVRDQMNPGTMNYPIRYFVTPNDSLNPHFNQAKNDFIMVPYADGGIVSTSDDVISWLKALHTGRVISDESYKLMTTKHFEAPNKGLGKNYVGYGLFITELGHNEVIYHHPGKALAIRSESGYIPSRKLFFAVLSNVMEYIPEQLAGKVDLKKNENQLDIGYYTQSIFNALR